VCKNTFTTFSWVKTLCWRLSTMGIMRIVFMSQYQRIAHSALSNDALSGKHKSLGGGDVKKEFPMLITQERNKSNKNPFPASCKMLKFSNAAETLLIVGLIEFPRRRLCLRCTSSGTSIHFFAWTSARRMIIFAKQNKHFLNYSPGSNRVMMF
jgi:hypothetical protein